MRSTGKRKDTNQPAMVKALRAAGFSVEITHTLGEGFPDLVVGYNRVTLLVEVKGEKGTLSDDEITFKGEWQGSYVVARAPHDVIEALYTELYRRGEFDTRWKYNALEICKAVYAREMAKLT